jgi:hypothetical protein
LHLEIGWSFGMTDQYIFALVLAYFVLFGVWAVVDPAGCIREMIRPKLREVDPSAISTVRFIGAVFIAAPILILVAFVLDRYR